MKTVLTLLVLCLAVCTINCQTNNQSYHVIEGSKIVIELIKAFSNKKDVMKEPGCKGSHADLCVTNLSIESLSVTMQHRMTNEFRDMVIQPSSMECCMHLPIGVWTYDLHLSGNILPVRKGDLLVEGCQNIMMNIKY